MAINFVSDWQKCHSEMVSRLSGTRPFFLGRIGGSDTDAVIDYFGASLTSPPSPLLLKRTIDQIARIKMYNGYYDKADSEEKFLRFCSCMADYYLSCELLTVGGADLLTMYFPKNINPKFLLKKVEREDLYNQLLNAIAMKQPHLTCLPFPFVEQILIHDWTLFRAFETTLPGKTVLVVSPFARSIEANFRNRSSFFKNYQYPQFTLRTYNTPITYSGLPPEAYPHSDWFETAKAIKEGISKLDFDIALLACGSYAMPVGVFIHREMERKAIYLGGVLQLFFGIRGRRYEDDFFLNQINSEYFIQPLEREYYLKFVSWHESAARDGFAAYF